MRAASGPDAAGPGWLAPVLILTGVFLLNFMARIIFAPLLPEVEADLGLSHAAAGSFFMVASAGYLISVVSSGLVSARLGHRRSVMLSAVCVGMLLLVVSRAPGTVGLFAGGFFLGLGAGFYLPSGMATMARLVDPGHWGRALGVHELAPNLTFVTAPLVAHALLSVTTWRGVLAILGLAALAWALVFWFLGPRVEDKGTAPSLPALRELARVRNLWLMGVLFGLGVGGSLGVYAMLPVLMINEHGMDPGAAHFWLSASRLAGVAAAFVAGWANDRLGTRRTLMTVFALAGAATVGLGLTPADWLLPFLFIQPTLAVCFFPAGFAAISAAAPAGKRALAVSLTAPLGLAIGGGALPMFIGLTAEALGIGGGIACAGAVMLLGVLVAARLDLALPARGGATG